MKKNLYFVFLLVSFSITNAQENKNIKLFYDCQTSCYESYVKQNISGVEFVRDPKFSDVHLQLTSETNGSGGETYHLNFMGQNDFIKIQKKLTFPTNNDMTDEIIRKKLLKYIKIGLVDFWIEKGMDKMLEVKLNQSSKKKEIDSWNNWIYKVGLNGWFNGDSNSSNSNVNGYISAKQVKEKHKFYFKMQYGSGRRKYNYGGNTILSETEWVSSKVSEILSINKHWSYGFFGMYNRSKYRNYEHSTSLSAGLEYDIFPYKDNAKKSFVFSAKIGGFYNKYFEKTIYSKEVEFLTRFNTSISGSFVQKWGNVYGSINYGTYLHNLKLNSFNFSLGTNIRITKGLNFRIYGDYSILHDQINIAAGNLSLEETLLAQKQIQSGYGYYFSVGLNYSLGSIYNTIVNPRFDSTEGEGRTCICF